MRSYREFRFALVLGLSVFAVTLVPAAQASPPESVTIAASKPLGPVPGTFSTSGAISDAGTFTTIRRVVSAVPAPTFLVSHLTLLFAGAFGTFTVEAQIAAPLSAGAQQAGKVYRIGYLSPGIPRPPDAVRCA